MVFATVMVMGIIARLFPFKTESEKLNNLIAIFREHHLLLVFTALTAGITEELMFRAYLIPKLQILFKSAYAPPILSSVFFGFLHVGYGTALNVAGPMVIGLVFGFHYMKYRNIKILMIAHFLWDYGLLLLKLHVTPQ
jgi:membrane protease YdiL (CAAX protease family)